MNLKVKLNVAGMSVPELIDQLRLSLSKIYTENITIFPNPKVHAPEVQSSHDDLLAARTAVVQGQNEQKHRTAIQSEKSANAGRLLRRLVRMVEDRANQERSEDAGAAVITAGGFQMASTDSSPLMMEKVEHLSAEPGEDEGEIRLLWKAQNSAIYHIDSSPDVTPRVWERMDSVVKARATLHLKASGTRWWFRVRAQGANNIGAWSEPANCMVP